MRSTEEDSTHNQVAVESGTLRAVMMGSIQSPVTELRGAPDKSARAHYGPILPKPFAIFSDFHLLEWIAFDIHWWTAKKGQQQKAQTF